MGYPHAFLASRLRPVHAFMSGFQNAEIHRSIWSNRFQSTHWNNELGQKPEPIYSDA
ncbi:MAG: hypothetical protein MG2_0951 [uncultured Candidatus Poseidoniales archaeon]|nr:MAG: hypothetical protein MG2_0951 [uncultured Candidatus Poseidoniales archaeon]